ncbi:hypothetical protein PHSY_005680 [Pseudozyma hubeiensis SY62]|uniref:Uncharacterized protein n=1 Tax=Pseudozyma hubeiensis (strain SY62) TaxID=1305764 RepID=R9P9P2_PSEHS|nr:hypothetical protein PHSY_005680 [Pseudozyma hubeiensis SY62]GAC98091.1 hypothetical protein PHSY_005680 [Pseudozyma hubeiensis SY62]
MVRSTQSSPAPPSTSPQRTNPRRLSRRIASSDSVSGDDDEQLLSSPDKSRQLPHRTPRFASVSADSDEDMHYDMHSIDSDGSVVTEDEIYLLELASATQIEKSSLSQQLRAAGDNKAKIYVQLLDPVKRHDMLSKQFHDFVPHSLRQTLEVPKRVGKDFNKSRSQRFIAMVHKPKEVDNDALLEAFEKFLADLMDCFDHPHEVIGWNPFAAFAEFVQAGAAHRSPSVLQSCSRLTLGLEWDRLSDEDKKRIGYKFLFDLKELHYDRMCKVNEILAAWDDKFRRSSTCNTCNSDPWEVFLLTTVIAMLKEGTKYVDIETASDTSSEADSNSDDEDEDMDGDDNHDQDSTDSEYSNDDAAGLLDVCAPRLEPIDDTQEPRQSFVRNYGPNAYILRIVSIDQLGCVAFDRSPFKVCPSCGYRFDGHDADRGCPFYQDLDRAFTKAREQISEIPEMIHMPTE